MIEFCDLKNEKEDLKLLVLGWKSGREVQEVEIAYELLKGAKSQKLLPPTMKIIRQSLLMPTHMTLQFDYKFQNSWTRKKKP